MLAGNVDTHINVLLTLSYNDLENYCFSSKANNLVCHNNSRIQNKLGQVSKMVNDTMELSRNDDGVELLPTNVTSLDSFETIMDKYYITFLTTQDYYTIINNKVISMTIYVPIYNMSLISYKIDFPNSLKGYKTIYTHQKISKQVKAFLFQLFYDNIIMI
jgi:hypothetical protein